MMEDFKMKTLFEVLRAPVVIGAFILAILIVVGSYIGSRWYYGDVEPVEVLAISSPIRSLTPSEVDLGSLQGESESTQTESTSTVLPPKEEPVDDFLAGLSTEEMQLLTEEVVEARPPRESIHGLGSYPEIPPDYPHQNLWEDLENDYYNGHANIEHELIHRVLIKLWNQGKKTESAVLDSDNGRVYPLYKDIVYVGYAELEREDGSVEEYMSNYRSHSFLQDYEQAVAEGTQPSWLKVVLIEDGGIEPYSFLGLN